MVSNGAHKAEIRVRFNECDMYEHVNHAQYLTYLEIARVEFLDDMKIPINKLTDLGYYLVVMHIDITYSNPAFFNQNLIIHTKLLKKYKTGGIFEQKIEHNNRQIVLAKVKWICTNSEGRPVKLPEQLKSI